MHSKQPSGQQQPQSEQQQHYQHCQHQDSQQQLQQQQDLQYQQQHPNLYLLKQLSREIHELDIGNTVDIISDPDAATFLRNYVASNKPVIIKGAVDHWPAIQQWSRSVLQAKAGDLQVSVATTPNGLADAVTPLVTAAEGEEQQQQQQECFCLPHVQQMAFGEFLELFFEGQEGLVPYLQVGRGADIGSMLQDVQQQQQR
jgi:jumonji domain-containing protein 7